MTAELRKRIITSIILFALIIFCIFAHIAIFIILVFTISYFTFNEIKNINHRILKNNSLLLNTVCIFYIFGIFSVAAISLYRMSGPVFLFYILLICISSDVGGYFIGKKIGGKKLTKISPNKTVSGSIGSFCFSFLPLIIFYNLGIYGNLYSLENFSFCLLISLVCQSGDLFISYLKRKAKVKDTGKILPGHGGLLDRIDGIIFTIPFVYIYTIDLSNYFKILF
jgi:phosphatidate cytidylyltransferase